jgi:hypothetical protein
VVGCERHICNIAATAIGKLFCLDEQTCGDLKGKRNVPVAGGRNPKDKSYTIQALKFLSRSFRTLDKDKWEGLSAEWGDFGEVAVSQGCRHLSEFGFARWLLPRLAMLKDFINKHKLQLKKAKKNLGDCLEKIEKNWDFFVWDVRVMAFAHHRFLFPLFDKADKAATPDYLQFVKDMDARLESELEDAVAMKATFTSTMADLDKEAAELQEYWKIAKAKNLNKERELSNPREVAAAKAKARATVVDNPPAATLHFPAGIVTRRKLKRLLIVYEALRKKFKEHSASLGELTVQSFVSQVARHNYAAENTMKHFRDALLKSQTKRIELIEVYTWLKLDRHLKGGQFRAGWGCPGISKLPRGVAESDHKILTIRARNVRMRHWVRRAQKRNRKRKAAAEKTVVSPSPGFAETS